MIGVPNRTSTQVDTKRSEVSPVRAIAGQPRVFPTPSSHEPGEANMNTPQSLVEKLDAYSVQVDSWDYLYTYMAEPLTLDEVNEFIHLETLEFDGKLLSPRARAKTAAKIRVACEKDLREGESSRYVKPVVGNLLARKKIVEVYVTLPSTHVTRLISIAASGRIGVIHLTATKLIGRKGLVRSFDVSTNLHAEIR